MKIKEATKVNLSPGDVLFIGIPEAFDFSNWEKEVDAFRKHFPPDAKIIFHSGFDLKIVPASEMEKAGWIRKP